MSFDLSFRPGQRTELGSHLFTAAAIIEFASKYDPQRFHIDEHAARESVFGGLCASGWHTASIWMKLNVAWMNTTLASARAEGNAVPEFGPSPGFRDLRWFRPVFAGDQIRYSKTFRSVRPLASRPGWSLLETDAEAQDLSGQMVMSFRTAALIKLPGADPGGQAV
ncbi:Acyl dehydratase [Hoeflea phototrophica DFL-43]|uniref:Acyl dehydratase n=1 Tax=Hoeflea phototrophica (strain DSM 17068 / NCIMB 14078 / DFL-43) TaxID=411684 RepID=A9DH95_HOEPD|nr:MaoC family dehydratase [Hoeflea phototrophica]EDQ31503.1 Acyl dehydratase [Hoeflea phototrophica DFL-43]